MAWKSPSNQSASIFWLFEAKEAVEVIEASDVIMSDEVIEASDVIMFDEVIEATEAVKPLRCLKLIN